MWWHTRWLKTNFSLSICNFLSYSCLYTTSFNTYSLITRKRTINFSNINNTVCIQSSNYIVWISKWNAIRQLVKKVFILIIKSFINNYVSYCPYIFQLLFLYLAWFIYGIAAAFESGTLDSYLINKLKRSSNDKLIESFISKDNKIQFASMIIGSGIGGILYFMIGIKIYIIAIILVCLSIFDIGFFFQEDRDYYKEK